MTALFTATARLDINVLDSAAKDGTFTPIIGAACSSLDHAGEPRLNLNKEVQARAAAIAVHLSEDEHLYLDELIDFDRSSGVDAATQRKAEPLDALSAFHIALLRLDRCAALTFKKGVGEYTNDAGRECEFLWKRQGTKLCLPRQLGDWRVMIELSESSSDLFGRLNDAIAAADRLVNSESASSWREQGLAPDGIYDNLIAFRSGLFNDAGQVQPAAALDLMDLVWLGNLFWHSLRFDLPYYPTTAELAFQISLYTPTITASSRRAPPLLAQAAQAVTDPLGQVTKWFETYSTCSGQSQFYKTLAQWLQRSFEKYADAQQHHRTTDVPLPLVFTTNYDQEIEKALDAIGCSYQVVIPAEFIYRRVGAKFEPQSPKAVPLWLLQTVDRIPAGSRLPPWQYAGQTKETQRSNKDTFDPFKPIGEAIGPVVVKLHGSPLAALPNLRGAVMNLPRELDSYVKSDEKYFVAYGHRIIITEADYLADLRQDLPRWLKQRLQTDRRNLFFLGHSIADWNIRLRLADHASWVGYGGSRGDDEVAAPGKHRPQFHRFAVNRSSGGFDVAFMGPLGIAYVEADLQLVQRKLASAV